MNYTTIIIIAIVGIVIGYLLTQKKCIDDKQNKALQPEQVTQKTERKQKILDFLRENREIKNNNVEKLFNVSDSTAERYLNELEKEGKITQHGAIGQNVFSTLK